MKVKGKLKTVAGILASGAAFSLTALLLVRLFGWPGLSLPLLGVVAVAWAVGSAAGVKLAGGWAAGVSLLLAVGLVVAAAWRGDQKEGTRGEERSTLYQVDGTFAYVASENDRPLENVAVVFPVPRAENGNPVGHYPYPIGWRLYKVDENGVWHLEMEYSEPVPKVHELCSPRTMMLNVLEFFCTYSPDGIEAVYLLDKLYPKEILWIYGWTETKEKGVTLKVPGENRSSAAVGRFSGDISNPTVDWTFDPPIHVVFWASLSKLTKVSENEGRFLKVPGEEYRREVENCTSGGLWLYPVS